MDFSFSVNDFLLVLFSVLIGLLIGAEREYNNKTAGLRTLMLVCVGACIFTILSLKIGVDSPSRIAANIITGIGFLGAGAIFKDENKINGLTTACAIWVMAALGMSIGSGHVVLAAFGALIVLIVLLGLVYLEKYIDQINRSVNYKITTRNTGKEMERYAALFKSMGLKPKAVSRRITQERISVHWRVNGPVKKHRHLTKKLMADSKIEILEY